MSQDIIHCMLDLETLGVNSNSPIVAIGAVKFTQYGLKQEFYQVIDTASAIESGVVDGDTLKWWMMQSDAARSALFGKGVEIVSLEEALCKFTFFMYETNDPDIRMWGNGADFDNVILDNAYRAFDQDTPWKTGYPFMNRCYRTIKNTYPSVKLKRVGTHHNALDDAKSQALHLIEIANAFDLELQ